MIFGGTRIKHHFPNEGLQNHNALCYCCCSEKKDPILPLEAHPVLPFQRLKSFHIVNCGSSQSKKEVMSL